MADCCCCTGSMRTWARAVPLQRRSLTLATPLASSTRCATCWRSERLYGRCCGDEGLNDHKALRDDVRMQTVVGRDQALASAPTFSRLENRATRAQAWSLHEVLAAQVIASHDKQPAELVLDLDASDVALHGQQEH